MKKKNFAMLVIGVIGGLLFSLGLCMCLLPEWNAFEIGVGCTGLGIVLLAILTVIALKGKKREKPIDWKLIGKLAFATAGALVLGVGMAMILVWKLLIPGIIVGIVGILMLLCLIPMFVGLK